MSKIKNPKKKRKAASKKFSSLQPGDLIEIIAPGSHTPLENLEKGAEVLRSWGYKVVYAADILKPELFLANSDEKRFNSFRKAMNNPLSKAVWCLRGGYGAIRLLPRVEKMPIPKIKKILIGLSDISSLHAVINQKWCFPSLHASLLDRLALQQLEAGNIQELRDVLENSDYQATFNNLLPLNNAACLKKNIKSQVVGGNLMVVTSTLGTPSQIQPRGKILFLEELSERSYRIDRCLQQLKQAGVFSGIRAVVFGDFTNCGEPNKENYVQKVLESFFQEMKIPAFTGVESGHGQLQRPLFFNTEAHLTCGENAQMIVYSAFAR